jgi:hypothetical protein
MYILHLILKHITIILENSIQLRELHSFLPIILVTDEK